MPKLVTIWDKGDSPDDEPKALERYAAVADEIVKSDPKRFVREKPSEKHGKAHERQKKGE